MHNALCQEQAKKRSVLPVPPRFYAATARTGYEALLLAA